MPPTFLVTGGSGLLALNLAAVLRTRCRIVLGLHQRHVALPGVDARPISLESPDAVARAVAEVGAGVVIHTAGLTNIEACESNPALAQHVNVELAANVARGAAAAGAAMVQISTDHLFAGDRMCVDESEQPAPLNVYGRTKAEAERRVGEVAPSALIVRTNFYGWGPSYRQSFSDRVIRALRAGARTTLFDDVFFTPILASEVAAAVHDLISAGTRGIVHVAGDDRVSKCAFGLALADAFSLDPSSIVRGRLADAVALTRRPADMSLSNAKASAILGRRLGGLEAQLATLREQEASGFAKELQNL